ncbi:MAG: AgmX/PglI C-terminal domain-containing protein [candidate division Zixibacteria bacterium]|nr:AgmX/PglI C-terminal domain-containing protein [candidate division Zixibacteria bacterium]
MAGNLYIHVDGKNYGPLVPEEVSRWIRDGRLGAEDYVWAPEKGTWVRAKELEFLAPVLGENEASYHVRIGSDTVGPMDLNEVVRLINERRFNAMDFVWLEGERRWARAGEVSFLSPYFLKQIREQVEEARLEKELEELEGVGRGAEGRESVAIPAWRKEARRDLARIDDRNYLKTLATMFLVNILIVVAVNFVEVPEPEEVRPAEVLSRVAKLVVDKTVEIPLEPLAEPEEVISAVVGTGTGTGGGPGGPGEGGGQGGEDYASVGVVGLITAMGADGTVADLMGAGGDLDVVAANIAGLSTGGVGTVGRGKGPGFGPGGLGGGLGGGSGLAGLAGLTKKVGTTRMRKARVNVRTPGITGVAATNSLRSSAVIANIVNQRKSGIEYIYKKYLKTNPTMEGKIVVRFTIAASGAVTACSKVSSTMANPAMEQEVCTRIMTWRFPRIDAGDVTVVYPFVFFSAGA